MLAEPDFSGRTCIVLKTSFQENGVAKMLNLTNTISRVITL